MADKEINRARFRATHKLSFTIPGRVISKYGGVKHKTPMEQATPKPLGRVTVRPRNEPYKIRIKLAAMQAAAECGWEKTEGPLYIIICLKLNPPTFNDNMSMAKKKQEIRLWRNKAVYSTPHLPLYMQLVIQALIEAGFIYQQNQLAGCFVVKKYTLEESMEVMVGTAESYNDMIHDLRNA